MIKKIKNIGDAISNIEEIKSLLLSYEVEFSVLDNQIMVKKNTIEDLSLEINRLNNIKNEIVNLDKDKEILSDEVSKLNNLIILAKEDLKDIENQKTILYGEIEKEKEIKLKELREISHSISEQKKITFPKINEIVEREKKVSQRERDIEIVIDRYKTLFAEKDSGFMI